LMSSVKPTLIRGSPAARPAPRRGRRARDARAIPAIRDALVELHGRWRAGSLDGTPLSPEWRERLSRAARVEELAELLESLA